LRVDRQRRSPDGSSTTSTRRWTSSQRGAWSSSDTNQPGIETDERGVFDAGRFRAAWIKDPDGNTMAITQVSG
jgi:hypothetical protein